MSEMKEKQETNHEDIFSEEFEIVNELGLHARAAVTFIKAAGQYESDITVMKDGLEVNGKSIMGILMLGAAQGTKIIVTAKGPDAEKAVIQMGMLISSKFGEEA